MSMNKYKVVFYSKCPVNEKIVKYHLTIKSNAVIEVEKILFEVSKYKSDLHENIADGLYLVFGAKQKLIAFHHGVTIVTKRGKL